MLTLLSLMLLLEADVGRFERAIPAALGKHTDVSFTKGVWKRKASYRCYGLATVRSAEMSPGRKQARSLSLHKPIFTCSRSSFNQAL